MEIDQKSFIYSMDSLFRSFPFQFLSYVSPFHSNVWEWCFTSALERMVQQKRYTLAMNLFYKVYLFLEF